ncbi:hypothetical protein MTO96_008825 [Rhipicephalus appendiculatus]
MNVLTFLGSEKVWRRTATLCWTWFSILLSLYGMSLSGRSDRIWHVVFLAVSRAVTVLLSWRLLLASGRKTLLSQALPLTCCMLLLYGTIKGAYEGSVTWIVGEIIVCMLIGETIIVNVFTFELYPTVVRGIGTFVAIFFGQLGATFGPILLQLQDARVPDCGERTVLRNAVHCNLPHQAASGNQEPEDTANYARYPAINWR